MPSRVTRQQQQTGGPAGSSANPESAESGPARQQAAGHLAGSQPVSIRVAAAVQVIEAVGVLAASLIAGVDALGGKSYHRDSGIAITLIGIVTAVLLAYVARGVQSGRRWSRTPAMLTQLFTGIVAIYLIQAPRLDWGIPAIALAIAGFGALLAPASLRVLTPGRPEKT
jgi:hypothetical protein